TVKSAFLACWFSSVSATCKLVLVAEITSTEGSFNLTSVSPLFCLLWMSCQTLSAASLLAGEQLACDRMNSRSLKESAERSYFFTVSTATSQGVALGLMEAIRLAGG